MSRLKNKTFTTLNTVTTAMLAAFAVVLSGVFHNLVADFATLFSPMHLPVFLAGILCGQWLGLICGFITPILSFLSTGRPPFPNGIIPMVFELACYGFLSGLFRNLFVKNPKTKKLSSLFAVALAMIAGRAVNAVAGAALLAVNNAPFFPSLVTKFLGNFTSTWVGIVLQLVLVPSLVFALQKSGVLARYLPPQEKSADISQSEIEGQNGLPDATHQQNTDG